MSLTLSPNNWMKIQQMRYHDDYKLSQDRSKSLGRNPIKIVVDMIGEDGNVHQKIIAQACPSVAKFTNYNSYKSQRKPYVREYSPPTSLHRRQNKTQKQSPFIFNRFNYDNYKELPVEKRIKMKSTGNFYRKEGHKNIQIIFCQNKLPDFIHRTNQKIQNICKKEQIKDFPFKKINIKKVGLSADSPEKKTSVKMRQKTNLGSCLKEYATLEKLSMFMESDQRRRQECICYQLQKDPSRNLLLDIITHRFSFLKNMNKRARELIYRCLLGRQVNSLTKINIHEYMKLSEMFVGRDANSQQTATFMYLFLFGEEVPSIDRAKGKLQLVNGHLHRYRTIMDELSSILLQSNSDYLVDVLAKKEKLLRMFIDYLIERE